VTNERDATLGRLVAEASRDLSALIQAEIQLAKSELTFSVKSGGIGVAMFLIAGFFAMLMTVIVSIGLALVVAKWVGPIWGFFIVAGVYLLLAVLVVIVGLILIKKVRVPKATIATAKEIPATFKSNGKHKHSH
jgi:hypothetical protein